MKKIFTFFVIAFSLKAAYSVAQQIPNKGFEQLNFDGSLSNWGNVYLFSMWFDSTGVSHLTDSIVFAKNVIVKITEQIKQLPRKNIVSAALQNSKCIVVKNMDEAIAFSNTYAPEHLILSCKEANKYANKTYSSLVIFNFIIFASDSFTATNWLCSNATRASFFRFAEGLASN